MMRTARVMGTIRSGVITDSRHGVGKVDAAWARCGPSQGATADRRGPPVFYPPRERTGERASNKPPNQGGPGPRLRRAPPPLAGAAPGPAGGAQDGGPA